MRIEPQMSDPLARVVVPAAKAPPAPPDEPPVEKSVFQGFRVTPQSREWVTPAQANSGAVERAFGTLQSSGYEPTIVLTGGDASRILNALVEAPMHRPHLVLEGLAHMLESAR